MYNVEQVDYFLDSLILEATPGLCASITTPDKVLYSCNKGFRAIDGEKLFMSRDTSFDMASLTKIIGPTMLCSYLLENKEISLDSKIKEFFPQSKDYKEATIFNLMTHSGGFIPELRLEHFIKNKDEVLPFIFSRKKEYEIGTECRYSCFGYLVLGFILEKVLSLPLDIACKRYVFDKLNLSHTSYLPDLTKEFAYTEKKTCDNLYHPGVVHDENAAFLGGVSGNAGIFSTIDDCTKFVQFLLQDDESYLSHSITQKFSTLYLTTGDEQRALGFKYYGNGLFGHTGFTGTSILINKNKQLGAVLLTNRVHPSRDNKLLLEKRNIFNSFIL
ncbi:MAG: beta-lactamase family protein [Spirochaetales bacterium]|nr:beta-lactamase family protein [Spirochaetales bacterium]